MSTGTHARMTLAAALFAVALLPALTPTASAAIGATLYALTADNRIAVVSTLAPAEGRPLTVGGLGAGETLAAIDVRPQNGRLYGVTLAEGGIKLYHIDLGSGAAVATPIGAAPAQFVDAAGGPVTIAGPVGIDFNPAVDRLRVVTASGLNLRINPNDGAPIDGNLNNTASPPDGINPDGPINGAATAAVATAYTNSAPNTAVTTQYTIDAAGNQILIQSPPNAGTQISPLPLTLGGAPLDIGDAAGLDILAGVNAPAANQPAPGEAFAALTVGGAAGLYRINLATGTTTPLGGFGGLPVIDLAAAPTIPAAAALRADGAALLRTRLDQPATVATIAITGVATDETLVGIDGRPATGQLFGLGVAAGTDNATLYLIDPQTGAATAVGTPKQIAFVDGAGAPVDLPAASAGYGIDFNPTVDRIRVVTGSGLNFRLNPNNGAPVDGNLNTAPSPAGINPDAPVNGLPAGSTGVEATAYTNSSAGATATTQYTLDSASNRLLIQNPPNAGTQVSPLAVTLGGAPLDFAAAGFDIPPGVAVTTSGAAAAGEGYAALAVGGSTGLYRIDLATGAATLVGPIGDGAAAGGLVVWLAPQRTSVALPIVVR